MPDKHGCRDHKHCKRCDTTKVAGDFYKDGTNLSSYCKECFRELGRQQAASGYFRRRYLQMYPPGSRPRKPRRQAAPRPEKPLTDRQMQIMANKEFPPYVRKIMRDMYKRVRKRAISNGIPFDLEYRDMALLIWEFCESNYHTLETNTPFQPSLDRIESAKGYVRGNVRVTWLIENLARNKFTDADVLMFCRLKLGVSNVMSGRI